MIYLNLSKDYNPFDSTNDETIRWKIIEEIDGKKLPKPRFELLSTFGNVMGIVITSKLETINDIYILASAVQAIKEEDKNVKRVLFTPNLWEDDIIAANTVKNIIEPLGFEEIATHQINENRLKTLLGNVTNAEMIGFLNEALTFIEKDEEPEEKKDEETVFETEPDKDAIFLAIRSDEGRYIKDTATLLGYGYNEANIIKKASGKLLIEPYDDDSLEETKEVIIFTESINDWNVDKINHVIMKLHSMDKIVHIITIHLQTNDIDYDFVEKVFCTDSYEIDNDNPKNYVIEASKFV